MPDVCLFTPNRSFLHLFYKPLSADFGGSEVTCPFWVEEGPVVSPTQPFHPSCLVSHRYPPHPDGYYVRRTVRPWKCWATLPGSTLPIGSSDPCPSWGRRVVLLERCVWSFVLKTFVIPTIDGRENYKITTTVTSFLQSPQSITKNESQSVTECQKRTEECKMKAVLDR